MEHARGVWAQLVVETVRLVYTLSEKQCGGTAG